MQRLLLAFILFSFQSDAKSADRLKDWKQSWTAKLAWDNEIDITTVKGRSIPERLELAQDRLAKKGGGVIYFPAGTYEFTDQVKLKSGIILRGADPEKIGDARKNGYTLPTRFFFPRYKPSGKGAGTPIGTAFKGITLKDPATASNCGVMNLALENGHIHFSDDGTQKHQCGKNRFVVGCILRNCAIADPSVPDARIGQKPWQRFTHRHHAAVTVKGENLLIANNRLPKSGESNFTMRNYIVKGRKRKQEVLSKVVFDYDNRPGLYVNDYGIGASGGSSADDGTPKKYPWGFRKGIVITHNYVYCTGRCAIAFCGEGVVCSENVIRFAKDVYRPTTTGRNLTTGSSTNDNRAVQMRGWRWTVADNDYEVYRNFCADRKYYINDGEGLMHEDHVNSTIVDSKLLRNKGNSYLSLYKTGGIDGLIVEENEITTQGGIAAIYVNANRNSGKYPCRNVKIQSNLTSGSGIYLAGSPASGNVIKGNRHRGPGGKLVNDAKAKLEDNRGYIR